MTARELFYSATQTPAQTPAPVPHAAPPKKRVEVATAQPKPPAPSPRPPAQSPPTTEKATPPAQHDNTLPGGGKLITVSAGMPTSAPPPATGTPLGLKYSLLKLINGKMEEVPTNSVFHAGDRIQFRVETNVPGYLYIISQGSSGTWKPMFPSPEADGGSNHVEGFHNMVMPLKTRFYFDEQAGTEKMFLVFSREKEADLENMIFSLQGGGKSKPAAAPAPEEHPQVLRASLDDNMVGRLRQTYARDLIIEAVDTPGGGNEQKENSVYVVNPTGAADSRLVADLLLVHK
jgi:hypothetical protein